MTLNVEIYSAVTINYSLSELFFHPYQLNKEICTNDKKKTGKNHCLDAVFIHKIYRARNSCSICKFFEIIVTLNVLMHRFAHCYVSNNRTTLYCFISVA